MKTFDIGVKIKTLKGEEVPIYYPSKEQQLAALDTNKKLDVAKLPRETVQDVLLTALEQYTSEDRRTTFLVHSVGSAIVAKTKVELAKMQVDFLVKVAEWATLHEEEKDGEKVTRGIYPAWKMAQVFIALGVTE